MNLFPVLYYFHIYPPITINTRSLTQLRQSMRVKRPVSGYQRNNEIYQGSADFPNPHLPVVKCERYVLDVLVNEDLYEQN